MPHSLQTLAFAVTGVTLLTLVGDLTPAQAAILYDTRGWRDVGSIGNDFDDDAESPGQGGEGFGFNSAVNITRFLWKGEYGPNPTLTPSTDNFSVRLFNGVSAITPFAIFSDNVSRVYSHTKYGRDVYNYAMTLSTPFRLDAGSYLLSIMNNTNTDPDDSWGWLRVASGGGLYRYSPEEPWDTEFAGGLAFAIEGTIEGAGADVPTPALLPGLLGLGMSIWRTTKRSGRTMG